MADALNEDVLEHAKKTFAELTHFEPAAYDRKSGEIRWIFERGYPAWPR